MIFARWPWQPPTPPAAPELKIEIPEEIRAVFSGMIEQAYYAGLIQGAICGILGLLILRYIFKK